MFVIIASIFVTVLQLSNGHPLETVQLQPEHEVNNDFSSRIVGGVAAPPGYARSMVALVARFTTRPRFMQWLVCGGTIITKRHVLSAAHCIEPFSIWGQLSPSLIGVIGSYYWNSMDTEITFCGYTNHPDWDWNTIKNDIGVLKTCQKIEYTAHVAAITLNFGSISGGQHASVTGWGSMSLWGQIPYHIQFLNVTVLSVLECHLHMKNVSGIGTPSVDPRVEICALRAKGYGMCHGDSGSPLFLTHTMEQIGIVSWGPVPCAMGAPDIFVRLGAFKNFIESVTGEYFV